MENAKGCLRTRRGRWIGREGGSCACLSFVESFFSWKGGEQTRQTGAYSLYFQIAGKNFQFLTFKSTKQHLLRLQLFLFLSFLMKAILFKYFYTATLILETWLESPQRPSVDLHLLPAMVYHMMVKSSSCVVSTGMVTVCAGCDAFRPWVAVLLGACGGSLYLAASLALVKLKIDDPLDASAIHASCGMSLAKVRAKMSKISVAFSGLLGLLANPIFRNNGILVTASEESLNMLIIAYLTLSW